MATEVWTDDYSGVYDAPLTDADLAEIARKRHARRQQIERIRAPFDAEIGQLRQILADMEADRDAAIRQHQDRISYYDGLLADYHRRRLAETGEKTLRLPYGIALTARRTPDRVEVDEGALASLPDEYVRVRREPDRRALMDHVRQTGEIPPGVTLIPGEVRFTVSDTDEKEEE